MTKTQTTQAIAAGDARQVGLCDAALDDAARDVCATAINAARAMED